MSNRKNYTTSVKTLTTAARAAIVKTLARLSAETGVEHELGKCAGRYCVMFGHIPAGSVQIVKETKGGPFVTVNGQRYE